MENLRGANRSADPTELQVQVRIIQNTGEMSEMQRGAQGQMEGWAWWYVPVIPGSWEAEVRGS
jgi:hypothetical protein